MTNRSMVTFLAARPEPGELCFAAACQRQKVAAAVILTFPEWLPSSQWPGSFEVPFWRECWRKSYPMCGLDLHVTMEAVTTACKRAGVAVEIKAEP
jgi:hypothetical protein